MIEYKPLKMPPEKNIKNAQSGAQKTRPPDQTFEEIRYLKHLIDRKIPVGVKLFDNEVARGLIEYYDHSFIRLTRTGAPNLFIFKHDIKYIFEDPK
jgi:sRNA-binding regulator protein Hfq